MMVGVDVRVQDQVVLMITDLQVKYVPRFYHLCPTNGKYVLTKINIET